MIKFTTQGTQELQLASSQAQLGKRLGSLQQQLLANSNSEGNFLGWLHLGSRQDATLLAKINSLAAQIKNHSQVLVVVGIGGSYLGGQAFLDALVSPLYNQLPSRSTPAIYFTGHSLTGEDWLDLLALIGERDWSVNVISKSGTTLEVALAWRFWRQHLVARYGEKALKERLVITSDPVEGDLRRFARAKHLATLPIPANVGGRFSVFTSVGLLPLAVAGVDISSLLSGVAAAEQDLLASFDFSNPAWQYAACRYQAWQVGKRVEVLATYQTRLQALGQWWQQLFAESEGKNQLGLYPDSICYPAALHSLGQYLQQGPQHILETILYANGDKVVPIPHQGDDGLDYLGGRDLRWVCEQTALGVAAAHAQGGVPNLCLKIANFSPTTLGYLGYFFQFSCALSALLLGVDPFNQPGVEVYKTQVKQLLQRQ